MVVEASLIHQAASFSLVSPYQSQSSFGWGNHVDTGSLKAVFVSTAISGLESLILTVMHVKKMDNWGDDKTSDLILDIRICLLILINQHSQRQDLFRLFNISKHVYTVLQASSDIILLQCLQIRFYRCHKDTEIKSSETLDCPPL